MKIHNEKIIQPFYCHVIVYKPNESLIYGHNFFHIAFEVIFYDYSQLYNHLRYLVIDFLVANDIIPFNEKGINRGRTPITFSLFNTNLR
jgi:hypothetical protein